jgi:hypothetical protein
MPGPYHDCDHCFLAEIRRVHIRERCFGDRAGIPHLSAATFIGLGIYAAFGNPRSAK